MSIVKNLAYLSKTIQDDENIYYGVVLPDDEELGESDLDFEDSDDDL